MGIEISMMMQMSMDMSIGMDTALQPVRVGVAKRRRQRRRRGRRGALARCSWFMYLGRVSFERAIGRGLFEQEPDRNGETSEICFY